MKKLFYLICFGFIFGSTSHGAKSTESMLFLGKNAFTLDSKIWSYSAPGVFQKSKLVTVGENDGLLIKFPESPDRRLTYLVRQDPLNTSAASECQKLKKTWPASTLESFAHGCMFHTDKKDGTGIAAWVFEDFASLKLFTITASYSKVRKTEVLKDLVWLKKVIHAS